MLLSNFAELAQVELACAEIGQFLYVEKLVGARLPECRKIALGQSSPAVSFSCIFRQRVHHHQALAFSFVGNGGYREHLSVGVRRVRAAFPRP